MARAPIRSRKEVLQAITEWLLTHGVPPTIEELRKVLKLGSTRTVIRYLRDLEAHGDIRRWSGARGIQPLRAPDQGVETVPVPLVGEAPTGPMMIAEECREGWVRLPRSFVRPEPKRFFLLRVRGDSMNRASVAGERLEEGDLALVRQQARAESGDIVVAVIDGEATIKLFAHGPGYFVLKPVSSDPSHQPIVLDCDFSVQGVVCRVLKKGSEILGLVEQ